MDLLAGGRDADVFRHGDGLVLRRYRDGRSAEREGALLRELAQLGYPVPAVESVTGPDLVMELVAGPTLAAQVLQGALSASDGGQLLAGLLDRLHALPWPDGQVRLHLDLHPFNVLMGPHGPVVIDWPNARIGPPGLDVAMSALILAQVATGPAILTQDPQLRSALPGDAPTSLVVSQLTELLRALVSHTSTSLDTHLADAVALRRGDRSQSPEELALLDDAAALVRSLT